LRVELGKAPMRINPEAGTATNLSANGAGQQRLTVNGLPTDSGPVFSPDGGQIAFQSNRDANFEIYAMGPNGEHQTYLTNDPAGDLTPDWQPLR
jgi:Tol biopolymer transport system component